MNTHTSFKQTNKGKRKSWALQFLVVIAAMALPHYSLAQCTTWLTTGNVNVTAGHKTYVSMAIDASNSPYVIYSDGSTYNTRVSKYTGGSWIMLDTAAFTGVKGYNNDIAIDGSGTPYVVFCDGNNGYKATVKKYNGTNWTNVGSAGFTPDSATFTQMAIDGSGTPYVCYKDYANGKKVTVKKYNGSSWVTVGAEGFSAGVVSYGVDVAINGSGEPYVVYSDDANGRKLTCKKFDGTNWVTVGSVGFSSDMSFNQEMKIDAAGNIYVAMINGMGGAHVYKYNGSTWTAIATPSSIPYSLQYTFISLALDNSGTPYLGFANSDGNYQAVVKKFNGSAWDAAGTETITNGATNYMSIAFNSSNKLYVAVAEGGYLGQGTENILRVRELNTVATAAIGGTRTVCAGGTTALTASAAGGTWSSNNTGIATVNGAGTVTGVATGTAIISYTVGSCPATVIITVNPQVSTLSGTLSIEAGEYTKLSADVADGAWSSGNTSVASVSGGLVQGLTPGTASISYAISNSCGSFTATTVVSVAAVTTVCKEWKAFATNTTNNDFAIDRSGNVYYVYKEAATGKATVEKYDGISSVLVGSSSFTSGAADENSIAVDKYGTPYVAFKDGANGGKVSVMKYNGSTWEMVGNPGFSIGAVKTPKILVDSSGMPIVAYQDFGFYSPYYYRVTVKRFNGTDWILTGSAIGSTDTYSKIDFAIANNGAIYIARGASGNIFVKRYNGSEWVTVGTYLSGGYSYGLGLTVDNSGTPYIAYDGDDGAIVKKYNGSAWITVGSGPIATHATYDHSITVDANGMPYVWFRDQVAELGGVVHRYNGSAWESLGVANFGENGKIAISDNGIVYVKAEGSVDKLIKRTTPLPALTGASVICVGGFTTYGMGGLWMSSNPAVAGTAYPSSYLIGGFSEGAAIITNQKGTCTVSMTVTVNPSSSAGSISGPSSVAVGSSVTMSSTVSGGTWSASNGNISIGSSGVVGGISAGSSTVSYTVLNSCGSGVATKEITVSPSPILGPLVISGSGTTTLSGSVSGGTWSTGCNEIATVDTAGIVTGVSNGLATITYTTGSGSATALVTVNMTPSAIMGTLTLCVGANTTLSHPIGGGTWTSSNSNATVSSTGVVAGMSAGTANITYAYGSGCSSISTVTVNAIPNAGVISGVDSMCTQGHATLSTTGSGGTWSVEAGAGVAIGASTGILSGGWIFTPSNPHIYYIATNSCGADTATKTVYIKSMIDPGYLPDGVTDVCVGSSISFAGYPGLTPGGSWWFNSGVGPDPVSVNSTTGAITGLIPVSGTSVYYRTANACGAPSIAVGVRVLASSAGTIVGAATVAVGSSTTLSSTVSGGTWSTGSANVSVGGVTGVVTGVASGTATMSYTVSNSCGTFVATKVVTVGMPVSITGTLVISGSGTTTLSGSAPGGTWSTGCNEIATVDAAGVVTGVSNGLATITYTTGSGSATAVVTVNMASSAIMGTLALCVGANTTLSHPIGGGTWTSSNSNATVSSAGVVAGVSAGTANITYAYGSGCASTVVVTVNAAAAAGTITGGSVVNAGAMISLSASVTGGTWSVSNSHASVGSTGVVTGVSAGSVVISYAVSSSCGTAVATHAVIVSDTSSTTVAAITGTLGLCAGTTTVLANATPGGIWSSSDISVATISSGGVVTGITAGTATISYTTSGGSATVTVTVSAAPAITGTANICPGTITTLSTTATGGSWTGGNASVAIVGSATGVVTGVGSGTANITYSLGSGCRASMTVTVNPAPTSITGTLKACLGTTTTLSTMTPGGSWSSSDATIASVEATTGIVTGITAGTVTVSYTTGAGCYRTATVTINPAPAAITGSMMICAGTTTTLTDATPGLSWTSGNTAVATVNPSTGVVTGVNIGTATITYTAASTNCITTAEVSVIGIPAAIAGPATGCAGNAITLTNSVPGGVWSSANVGTATVDATTGVVTGVASGMVNITYSTGAGCYKTKQITINNAPIVSGYSTVCVGLTTTLSGTGGTWSSSTPSVATIVASGGYVTGVSAGTSTMTFTSTSTGCFATSVVTVIPVPAAIAGPVQACTGDVLTLTNSTPGGVWASSNNAGATVGSATGITNIAGTGGSVTISYSFGNNCRVTKAIALKSLPAIIGGTPTVCTPVTTTLTNTTSGGTWTSSDASVATVGTAISASYGVVTGVSAGTAEITYTITSTGCARSTVVTVNAGLNAGTITSSGGFTLHTSSAPTSVTLSSTGAVGGTWSSSNAAVATVNPTTGVVTAVGAGSATITYAVTASCTNIATKAITVTAGRPVGSMESVVGSVQLYPNPTTGAFTLVSDEAGTLRVYTVDGRDVTGYEITAGINPLDLPKQLASGIYMCRFTGESGSTTKVRLVYER